MTIDTILKLFRLGSNAEDPATAMDNIHRGVSFRGANILILVFAIIIASVGLNVNSAAVVIGAMLISPLMGPIVAVGAGLGVFDLNMVKRGLKNIGLAVLASVATSTIYFLVSPLDEAHSEILARTTPTIWDVLIALAGGFAGIIATASKDRGNVVPGVAIATALMPPLCTAGFGLAHLNWPFFFGAFYLFIINSVFISLAALFTVRWLGYPRMLMADERLSDRVKRLTAVIVVFTVLPSIYLAYRLVRQNTFTNRCSEFIAHETDVPENFLVRQEVDAKRRVIHLTYMGRGVDSTEVQRMRGRLDVHDIPDAVLEVQTGLSLSRMDQADKAQLTRSAGFLEERNALARRLQMMNDSIETRRVQQGGLEAEARAEHPDLLRLGLSRERSPKAQDTTLVMAQFRSAPDGAELKRLENWLRLKLPNEHWTLVVATTTGSAAGASWKAARR